MPRDTVKVQGSVLRWARETAGLAVSEASERLATLPETLADWESRGSDLSMTKLRQIAAVYKRPIAVLLRSEPPVSSSFPTDFRTIGGRIPQRSPSVLAALKRAKLIQQAVGMLPEDLRPRTAVTAASEQDSPSGAAAAARDHLGVGISTQISWSSANLAFNAWRGRIQACGVLVLVERMPREHCRGFALWDDELPPVIVVSNDEVDEAKSFTMLHELGHLVLRSSAACLELDGAESRLGRTEAWCNRFAASALIPIEALATAMDLLAIRSPVADLSAVTALARRLRVSRHVIALRLEELGLSAIGLYRHLLPQMSSDGNRQPRDPEESVMLTSERRAISELGFLPTLAVLRAVEKGDAGAADAARLLRVPTGKLASVRHEADRVKSTHSRP